MKFANIQMLFLFWAVPLLGLVYWYGWRRRRNILRRFADGGALAALVPPGLRPRRRLRAALTLAAALMLVVALAGPQYGFRWQQIEQQGVDLVIALDCSRSMLAKDIQPTRLDRAKREIIDLLAMLQGDRVGLVAFGGTAFLQCPLTMDYSAFDLFLNVLTPDYLPMGGTDLGAAVRTGLSAFDPQSAADKALILITDGENTGADDPEEAARAARKAGVKLFCIGVGSAQGVPVPTASGGYQKDDQGQIVLTRLDEPLLTRMAVTTGGTYVRSVAGDMDLDVIYRDRIHGTLTGATVESGRRKVWAQRFQWPLAAAVALLLAAQALPTVKKPLAGLIVLWALLPQGQAQAGPLQEGYKAYQQGQYDQALEKFVQGQLKDPENPAVLYNLGNAYYKAGKYDDAAAHYGQALSQAPPDLKAKLLYNLGNTDYRRKDLQSAIKNYQAALELSPEDAQARENLDFVKKVLQQQQQQNQQDSKKNDQQQSSEQQQQRQDQQNQKDQKDPQDQQSQQQQQNQQQQNQQDQHAQQGQQGQPDQSQQQAPQPPPKEQDAANPQIPPQDQDQEQPAAQQAPKEPASAGGEQPGQSAPAAAQILNRLKDEPGRAMMPRYQKMPVDKDW